jgi:hypothetical protein
MKSCNVLKTLDPTAKLIGVVNLDGNLIEWPDSICIVPQVCEMIKGQGQGQQRRLGAR